MKNPVKVKAPPVNGMARLTLRIDNRTDYRVRRYAETYRLIKNNRTVYVVRPTNDGATCTCPDFMNRDRPGGCKHIRALRKWFNL